MLVFVVHVIMSVSFLFPCLSHGRCWRSSLIFCKFILNYCKMSEDNEPNNHPNDDSTESGSTGTFLSCTEFIRIPITPVLPLADVEDIRSFEIAAKQLLLEQFDLFLQQPWYVFKLDFINHCIDSKVGIFIMPPGTGKTVLCHSLRHFLNKKSSPEIRKSLTSVFKDNNCVIKLEQMAKYNVIHIDFDSINYQEITSVLSFRKVMRKYLARKICTAYPLVRQYFENDTDEGLSSLLRDITRLISENETGKCIVLIDNFEDVVNWMTYGNCEIPQEERHRIALDYLYMLADLYEPNNDIFKVIIFGCHVPYGFYDAKFLILLPIYDVRDIAVTKYFFFSSAEAEMMLSKIADPPMKLDGLKSAYGGYSDLLLPWSVILAVYQVKGLCLTRVLSHNGVLLCIERNIASLLTYFLCGNSLIIKPNFCKTYEFINEDPEVAYAYFVRAGILTCNKINNTNEIKLTIANDEAKNLAARFVEKQIDVEENSSLLQQIESALKSEDLVTFQNCMNNYLETYSLKELSRERDYQNIIHSFVICAAGKSFRFPRAEREGRGNKDSGRSGYYDLRFGARDHSVLYLMELKKRIKKPYRREETREEFDQTVSEARKNAFNQIKSRGYVSEQDFEKYDKIIMIAVVGSGKRIFVFKEDMVPPPKPSNLPTRRPLITK